ncbi:Uncharacterised protein [Chlamydia trachomatis]|nr:Uncharacterised protein [Chlamydia trachomatis]
MILNAKQQWRYKGQCALLHALEQVRLALLHEESRMRVQKESGTKIAF